MIKKSSIFLSLALMLGILLLSFSSVFAASDLKGRLLLQVEDKGKAWYVDPATGSRAYLGSQENALKVVRSFGMGISNANLDKIDKDSKLAKKLAGKILLQVESRGEAWYVSPVDLKKYYLGKAADMYGVMKKLSLGITNINLAKISVLSKYNESSSGEVVVPVTPPVVPVATTTLPVATSTPPTPPTVPVTPTCSSWTYSDWSVCDASKLQTRTALSASPAGCVGGTPVLSQACELSFNVNVSAGNTPSFIITDKATVEVVYNIENASKVYPISITGIVFENNLDTSGTTYYYDKTFLNVYDAQNKVLATKNLVNNATNDLVFSSPLIVNAQSSSTLRVVMDGFAGDFGTPHMIVKLLNMSVSPAKAVLKGLSIDSNIYRRQ